MEGLIFSTKFITSLAIFDDIMKNILFFLIKLNEINFYPIFC